MRTRRDFLKTAVILPALGASSTKLDAHVTPAVTRTGRRAAPETVWEGPRYLDRTLPGWIWIIEDEASPALRESAYWALPHFGASLIPSALYAVPRVGQWSRAHLVACIAGAGGAAVPVLLQLLNHSSALVRASACRALVHVYEDDLDYVPFLARACDAPLRKLTHPAPAVRSQACREFDEALAEAAYPSFAGLEVIASVARKVEDTDRIVRQAAVETIGQLPCEERFRNDVFSTISYALGDDAPVVRRAAAKELWRQAGLPWARPPREDDLRRLRDALNDPVRGVRRWAAAALRRLPGGPYIAKIMRWKANPPRVSTSPNGVYVPRSRRIRDYPETILEAEFRPPLACLVRCLESSVARERAWALTAMGNLGKDALPVEHAMAAALHDPDMAVRLAAAMSLGRIGSTSIRTAGGLRLAFEDPCSQVAVEAHRSFLEIVLTGRQLNP